ncbi:MAG: rRNA pseudouridine synthase [Oscillospiraceae bacterium]|jgi:16S rRNA pseudouridine516 synthase|nr:rRNA pseudouridine synthase [Oscillospiraceae bacterium]
MCKKTGEGAKLPGGEERSEVALERLDKLLASTGHWSRKEVKDLIRQGRILVNGHPALRPEEKWDPMETELTVDGQKVDCAPFTYLMLHKPAGLLSATEDRNQRTVLDLLPEYLRRRSLFPVGRLDKDTEGLLLLTDDGPLGHALLSPKRHVDKVYLAHVDGTVDQDDVEALAQGMVLGDGLHCLPAGLEPLEDGRTCLVTLREGKYHQVKRMMAARGKPVTYLKRLSMGPLKLDERLAPGEWRPLTQKEVLALSRFG